jgi:hypothetical protein
MKRENFEPPAPIMGAIENEEGVREMCDLTDLNDAYSNARYGNLPSGIYAATIRDARVQLSNNQNRQVVWDLEVEIEADFKVLAHKFSPLVAQSMGFFRRDMSRLGIILRDMNNLHGDLQSLLGARIEIEVVNELEHYSVSFSRLISRSPRPETPGRPAAPSTASE